MLLYRSTERCHQGVGLRTGRNSERVAQNRRLQTIDVRRAAGADRDDEYDRLRLVVLRAQKLSNPRSVKVRVDCAGVKNAL